MDAAPTLIVLAAAAIALAVAFWRDHRPRRDSLDVRWVPWRFLMLLAAAIILFCLVHLVNLGGLTTGQGGARF